MSDGFRFSKKPIDISPEDELTACIESLGMSVEEADEYMAFSNGEGTDDVVPSGEPLPTNRLLGAGLYGEKQTPSAKSGETKRQQWTPGNRRR